MAKSQGFHQVVSLSVAALAIAFGIGCSSSNAAAPAAGVTSVDQSKPLSSLSASDMQTLCNDFHGYLVRQTAQDYAAIVCMQSGLFAANAVPDPSQASQACHNGFDACMNDPTNTKDSSGLDITKLCPDSGAPSVPTCSLTVAQYVACLNELIPAAIAAWATLDGICDNLAACTGSCNPPINQPSSCASIGTSCPGMTPAARLTVLN